MSEESLKNEVTELTPLDVVTVCSRININIKKNDKEQGESDYSGSLDKEEQERHSRSQDLYKSHPGNLFYEQLLNASIAQQKNQQQSTTTSTLSDPFVVASKIVQIIHQDKGGRFLVCFEDENNISSSSSSSKSEDKGRPFRVLTREEATEKVAQDLACWVSTDEQMEVDPMQTTTTTLSSSLVASAVATKTKPRRRTKTAEEVRSKTSYVMEVEDLSEEQDENDRPETATKRVNISSSTNDAGVDATATRKRKIATVQERDNEGVPKVRIAKTEYENDHTLIPQHIPGVEPYALQIIRAVCQVCASKKKAETNQFLQMERVLSVLNQPLAVVQDGKTDDSNKLTETKKDRLIRLQLRHRYVACLKNNGSAIDFSHELAKYWSANAVTQQISTTPMTRDASTSSQSNATTSHVSVVALDEDKVDSSNAGRRKECKGQRVLAPAIPIQVRKGNDSGGSGEVSANTELITSSNPEKELTSAKSISPKDPSLMQIPRKLELESTTLI